MSVDPGSERPDQPGVAATADLCDTHGDRVTVLDGVFASYGGRAVFCGPIVTLSVFEDNSLVRDALEEPDDGRVLVVAGGGSTRCALLGGTWVVWPRPTAGRECSSTDAFAMSPKSGMPPRA